jgi:hypothetical protein
MNYLEAAIAVLGEEGRPLTTRELTDLAIARGLIAPTGRTPEATMSARLYLAMRRHDPPVERVFRQGPTRAARGSVRWRLRGQA